MLYNIHALLSTGVQDLGHCYQEKNGAGLRRETVSSTLVAVMRRSNRNFDIRPGQTPGIWLSSVPGEWGI